MQYWYDRRDTAGIRPRKSESISISGMDITPHDLQDSGSVVNPRQVDVNKRSIHKVWLKSKTSPAFISISRHPSRVTQRQRHRVHNSSSRDLSQPVRAAGSRGLGTGTCAYDIETGSTKRPEISEGVPRCENRSPILSHQPSDARSWENAVEAASRWVPGHQTSGGVTSAQPYTIMHLTHVRVPRIS